jgi:EAL domain-containing protein (putative c-di-GMP-specific phosphodiesterase class I)
MHFLGVFLSVGALVLMMVLDVGRDFISTTYSLSPEITVLILIGYCYPLILFAFSYFVSKEGITRKFFQSQVVLGTTLCVSLGLIGTFIGLSSMVASISSGMNADGDFSEKINTLLASIGTSLDAMSLAFLTSILGVGASTVLSVACNYLAFFYKNDESTAGLSAGHGVSSGETVDVATGVGAKEIAEAINKALDLKMFEILGDSISENNQLQKQLAASLDKFETTQERILTDGLGKMSDFSEKIVEQMSHNNTNLQALHGVFERFDGRFKECVNDFNVGLEKVSNFSYRIASEVGNNTNNLQALQLIIERFDTKFESYHVDFNEAMKNTASASDQVAFEMTTANTSLYSLLSAFDNFENNAQSNVSRFNDLIVDNTECMGSLSSVMSDLKLLLAPPLNETLETAINSNTLDILYQPQVNASNEVIGCEVLLQWEDPIRGLISNSDIFCSEMETHSELMENLDKWVINNSLKQLAEWMRVGAWREEWVLSINIVPQMALNISLVNYLKDIVDQYSINPQNIAIEFKESIVLDNVAVIKDIFVAIKNMGFKIYVDNYGKSHSSLVVFQKLNIDKLKIDRSVINDLINEDGDTSIIRSIMASAKELELELMVDGVENDIQKMKLEELGFTHFQGYFVSHPIIGSKYLSSLS